AGTDDAGPGGGDEGAGLRRRRTPGTRILETISSGVRGRKLSASEAAGRSSSRDLRENGSSRAGLGGTVRGTRPHGRGPRRREENEAVGRRCTAGLAKFSSRP